MAILRVPAADDYYCMINLIGKNTVSGDIINFQQNDIISITYNNIVYNCGLKGDNYNPGYCNIFYIYGFPNVTSEVEVIVSIKKDGYLPVNITTKTTNAAGNLTTVLLYPNETITDECARIKSAKEAIRNAVNGLGGSTGYTIYANGEANGEQFIPSENYTIEKYANAISGIKYGLYITATGFGKLNPIIRIADPGDLSSNIVQYEFNRDGNYSHIISKTIFVNRDKFSIQIGGVPVDTGTIKCTINNNLVNTVSKDDVGVAIRANEPVVIYRNENFTTDGNIKCSYLTGYYTTPYDFAQDRGFCYITIDIRQND